MASVIGEAVIGNICEMVVEMAIQKLTQEASLVVNFRKDLIWLMKELTNVRGFLQAASQHSQENVAVKQWLENIGIIALRAEDIFEEYAVESMYENNAQSFRLRFKRWAFQYKMGRKIKDIKERTRSFIEEANRLKLVHGVLSVGEELPSTSQSVDWRRSNLLPSDSHPVGIQYKVDYMLSLLDNPAFPVVAVVGMGGVGKTYLVQHLYNITRERYEKSIWLLVSQSYSIPSLQKDLAFHLDLSDIKDGKVSEQQAAHSIHEKLQGKRCLVVLDDVWRASRQDLLFKLGLPTGEDSPCKIVVTTRSKDVCRNLDAEMYEIQYLSEEESWSLFSFYAFRGNKEKYQQLEKVGHEIVKQCGNLPVAIKTIARSLANTTIPWETRLRQLKGAVTAIVGPDPILPVLRLSYDSLPARLKACFAYLSFFPEDEEIECEYLVNLWIGEGFVPAGEEQWDMAWDCLYQLANLCLLELWEGSKGLKLTKYCKLHGLLHDLAIQISRENICAFTIEEASTHKSGGTGTCRILLAKKDIGDDAINKNHPVCLRTLSLSQNENITRIPAKLFTAMRGLRVLDLSYTRISTLPGSVKEMKLLKVLNLRNTYVETVPECVRHLKSLLFLAMPVFRRCPAWISELKCLQHLDDSMFFPQQMPKRISTLASLRTLRTGWLAVSTEKDDFMRLEDLGNMTELQELRLVIQNDMELKKIEEGILAQLVKMRYLGVGSLIGDRMELPQFPEKIRAMKHLESLTLNNFAMPSWICAFSNLKELALGDCDCSDYPELQRMPNLVKLWMMGNRRCKELPKAFGEPGGFPRLRFLTIYEFLELEELPELQEGAMACLEVFHLLWGYNVKKVGEGLEHLKRLREFNYWMSGMAKLKETFKEGGGYHNKIKANNPRVNITNDPPDFQNRFSLWWRY